MAVMGSPLSLARLGASALECCSRFTAAQHREERTQDPTVQCMQITQQQQEGHSRMHRLAPPLLSAQSSAVQSKLARDHQ